ncbi:MAG: zinc ribbon domain-containing protein [Christensenellales bacterium]
MTINTLLGSPHKLVCQCCGMPLEDETTSREPDGEFNEDFCKWCYTDGKYTYTDMDTLIDFCAEHMSNESFPPEQVRAYCPQCCQSLNIGIKMRCNTNCISFFCIIQRAR